MPKKNKTAQVIFRNSDGREFTMSVSNDPKSGETSISTDFGENGASTHDDGLHAQLWMLFMNAISSNEKQPS
jgi:hypothetical protein